MIHVFPELMDKQPFRWAKLYEQTDGGKSELAQQVRRARAAMARAIIARRNASSEDRKREEALEVFGSFDLDGSGTIDVSKHLLYALFRWGCRKQYSGVGGWREEMVGENRAGALGFHVETYFPIALDLQ